MWDEIISMAMNNGLWAVLFCLLFLYQLKDSRRREHKYQDTVAKLTDNMEIVRDIKDECDEIREECGEIRKEIRTIKAASPSRKKVALKSNTVSDVAAGGEAV